MNQWLYVMWDIFPYIQAMRIKAGSVQAARISLDKNSPVTIRLMDIFEDNKGG